MKKTYTLISGLVTLIALAACTAGNIAPQEQSNTRTISTFDYNPGSKTGVHISIGGSNPIIAEIDTGSDLTVVNESAVKNANIRMTSESLSLTYGGGYNTVKGYIGYGSVTFTTITGKTISSSESTPILVVTEGTVDLGGGNNAILGMEMDNTTSVRLFLPYPFNQMMILNRPANQMIFGNLTPQQMNNFSRIQLESGVCSDHKVISVMNNTCWATESIQVNYTYYDESGTKLGETTYNTLFDSGAGNSLIQISPKPSWIKEQGGVVKNPITALVNTSSGNLNLPLSSTIVFESNSDNKVNAGNNLFNTYQVVFDQANGIIGLLSAESSY